LKVFEQNKSSMKNYLKSTGILFVILGVVLSLFDFLIDNKEVIFIVGIICIIVSYFLNKNFK